MTRYFTLFIAGALVLASALSISNAAAQSADNYLEVLKQLNKTNVIQSNQYRTTDELLRREIVDSKNKVVGELNDVIVNDNGSIASMQVNFNRLRLGSDIFLNMNDVNVDSMGTSYRLGMAEEEIDNMIPQLLAGVETAAGNEDTHSVRRIIGSRIKDQSGRTIGEVDNVLFDAQGRRALALYISMKLLSLRGQNMAVPFNSAQFDNFGEKQELIVSNDQAEAMVRYAEEND